MKSSNSTSTPLFADENGVLAVDARVRVQERKKYDEARLAIRPYPKNLEEEFAIDKGRVALLRADPPRGTSPNITTSWPS